MNKLVALMALDLRGQADGRAWADRLRERTYLLGGSPPEQRPHNARSASSRSPPERPSRHPA
jgi:hypothetical protein